MIIYKKKLGQNFLKNKFFIKKIIKIINPKKNQIFIEIGSGTGNLTKEIIKYTNNITALEIDEKLIKIFTKKIKKKIKLINIDVLKFDFLNFFKKKRKKIRIFGNIPYYISNKIIHKFIKYKNIIYDINIVTQKEFSESLIYKKKKRKKISILLKLFYNFKKFFNIENKNFFPKPKINSTFINLTPNNNLNIYKINKIENFKKILNISFNQQRKKIKNNLKPLINYKKLKKIGINIDLRPNELGIKKYCILTKFIEKNNTNNFLN